MHELLMRINAVKDTNLTAYIRIMQEIQRHKIEIDKDILRPRTLLDFIKNIITLSQPNINK